jgi:hypothetical protein
MAAQHDHFFRLLAPAQLAYHVVRNRIGLMAILHDQVNAHSSSIAHQTLHHQCVLHHHDGCGNRRRMVFIFEATGMP